MGLVLFLLIFAVIAVVVGVVLYRGLDVSAKASAVTAVVVMVIGGLFAGFIWSVSYRHEHWATCHVTGKDRGGDDGSYRVYTDNCDTLANEDSLFRGKFDSSNVWQQIEPGHTYEFRIVGSRQPFFSLFANILEVRPANVG